MDYNKLERRVNVMVVDGQGGRIGRSIIDGIKAKNLDCFIIAVGTNSVATSTMLKASPDAAATGENPVIVNSKKADIIAGPIGIAFADALYGEISSKMANAIASSPAKKLLLPLDKCNFSIMGVEVEQVGDMISECVLHVSEFVKLNC